MNCPVCQSVNLLMSERQGIEIDYCPQCRGVWLDRGELDKIIEKSAAAPAVTHTGGAPVYAGQAPQEQRHSQHSHQPHHSYPQHGGHYKKKKHEGFLSDLFDFD